ncbi:MAG: hypothetical protein EZS28_025797 [Streblomastix strix]|uniref:Uncharacterized protein n=1 Tax=Streblomastix strix TaxID=222440 RepID=A0A5J4V772_9EUKA|nr:MAG: hypothetical protein EZS28_025797 [Streblomastix strix]
MKREIIQHLKQLLNDPELKRRKGARIILKGLSKNVANRTEIEKDGFRIPEEEQEQLQVQDDEKDEEDN